MTYKKSALASADVGNASRDIALLGLAAAISALMIPTAGQAQDTGIRETVIVTGFPDRTR